MALSAPVDREFAVLPSGHVRDRVILANFREGLRALINPETGQLFTEDEIQRATQPKSRWYNEAQGIDDYGQGEQRGAIWLSDQVRLERASTKWLTDYHGRLWGESKLPATGGTGTVQVKGVAGTIVVGSTTIGDPNAYKARDPNGSIYQVFIGGTIPASGLLTVTMAGITTGAHTNPVNGTVLTWTLRDPNMEAQATVTADFTGGTAVETDAEFASRMGNLARHRPAAGNDAHFRAWGRASSNAVEDAFIYPTALHAGSTIVAITQKRGTAVGPNARVPNATTMAAAIARLTPPTSPDVPPRVFVLVVPVVAESTNLSLRLSMAKGSIAGFADVVPFPAFHATTPKVTTVTSQTEFRITCPGDATLPGQASGATLTPPNAPQLMIWNDATSQFVEVTNVTSIQDMTGNVFKVILSAPLSITIALNQIVSPFIERHAIVAQAITAYFDELGPGELFNLDTDIRGARGVRFPLATEERPYRAGGVVATRIIEALGGSASDATLESISKTTPTFPTDLSLGPNLLVPGTVGVYSL